MNTKCTSLAVLILSAGNFACTPAVEPKSVKFYEDNPSERKTMMLRCKDLKADASKDANCVNARSAELAAAGRAPIGTVDFKKPNIPGSPPIK